MILRPLVAAAALAAAAVPALPAHAAGPCAARADLPFVSGALVSGNGEFACAGASEGMTIRVCIEVLAPSDHLGNVPSTDAKANVWLAEGCSTATAPGSAFVVDASAWSCVMRAGLVRTSVTGWNADGDRVSAASAPNVTPGAGSCGP